MVAALSKCFDGVQKVVFCLFVAIDYRLPRILREMRVFDNELVQVVPQEISARVASVPVEHSEETALGPVLNVLLGGRLHDVEHDAHTVLVVVSDDPLVRIRCVTHCKSVFTHAALRWLPTRQV